MNRKSLFLLGTLLLLGAASVQAHDAGQLIIRGGPGFVEPKSDNLGLGTLDLGGGITLTSASVDVDTGTSLAITGTYMITRNWAFDVLVAWPFEHDIDIAATISDGVTTVSGKVPLGETKQLPPTFSLQYHFAPDGDFQPYVGAGLNWTTFFSEEVSQDAIDGGVTDLSLDDSFGVAAQVGGDWFIGDHWLVNFDVRWINIESDATLTIDDGTGPVTGEVGTVEIDPWVYSLNIGFRF